MAVLKHRLSHLQGPTIASADTTVLPMNTLTHTYTLYKVYSKKTRPLFYYSFNDNSENANTGLLLSPVFTIHFFVSKMLFLLIYNHNNYCTNFPSLYPDLYSTLAPYKSFYLLSFLSHILRLCCI